MNKNRIATATATASITGAGTWLVAVCVALMALTGRADADDGLECRPLHGEFVSQVAPVGCTSPVGFCTQGQVVGDLRGGFALMVESFLPAPGASGAKVPVQFFVGESVVTFEPGGDQLIGTDTGALNFSSGTIGTLLTFTEGTGDLKDASGHIVISGLADFLTGVNFGTYRGELCVASD